jgi:hypothetical protein
MHHGTWGAWGEPNNGQLHAELLCWQEPPPPSGALQPPAHAATSTPLQRPRARATHPGQVVSVLAQRGEARHQAAQDGGHACRAAEEAGVAGRVGVYVWGGWVMCVFGGAQGPPRSCAAAVRRRLLGRGARRSAAAPRPLVPGRGKRGCGRGRGRRSRWPGPWEGGPTVQVVDAAGVAQADPAVQRGGAPLEARNGQQASSHADDDGAAGGLRAGGRAGAAGVGSRQGTPHPAALASRAGGLP